MGSQIKTQQKVLCHKWSQKCSRWWLVEHGCCHVSALETGMQCSDRYGGAWPFRHRWMVTASLKRTRSEVLSQCSWLCSILPRLRSDFPVTTCAAAYAIMTNWWQLLNVIHSLAIWMSLQLNVLSFTSTGRAKSLPTTSVYSVSQKNRHQTLGHNFTITRFSKNFH